MKKLAAVIFVIACSACRAPEKAVPAQMPPQTAASARNVTEAKSQLANPASVNCTKLGGQLEMKTSPLGEYGMNLSYAGNARRIAAKPVTQVFQSLSFPIALNSRNSLTPSLQAAAETIPEPQFTNYTVSLTLRRRLYRSWLFGSFTVAGDYSRDNHYIFSPRAGVQLELFFGGGA